MIHYNLTVNADPRLWRRQDGGKADGDRALGPGMEVFSLSMADQFARMSL